MIEDEALPQNPLVVDSLRVDTKVISLPLPLSQPLSEADKGLGKVLD